MSKIEGGRVTLKTAAFDLHRLLGGLTEMFGLRADREGLALRLDLAPDVPRYLSGDEGKLRQVLMNLLGNAVKFTQHGSITLRVSLAPSSPVILSLAAGARESSAGATHDPATVWLRFAVEDTGPGIAPDEAARLFGPFVRTQTGQQAQEGTGLGLSISQQYAHLMGGEIATRATRRRSGGELPALAGSCPSQGCRWASWRTRTGRWKTSPWPRAMRSCCTPTG